MNKLSSLIVLMLIPSISFSLITQYIDVVNNQICGQSTSSQCVPKSVPKWTTYSYTSNTQGYFIIGKAKDLYTDAGDLSYFKLTNPDANFQGSCIQTSIQNLKAGDYTLSFKLYGNLTQVMRYQASFFDNSNRQIDLFSLAIRISSTVSRYNQSKIVKLSKDGKMTFRFCDTDTLGTGYTKTIWIYDIRFYQQSNPTSAIAGNRVNNIVNCNSSILIGIQNVCYVCSQNYVFQSFNKCVPFVQFCSVYNNSLCSKCISNYSLVGQTCIKLPQKCQALDSTGSCSQCQNNFIVQYGKFVEKPKIQCLQSEYKDINGLCVKGTVGNCVKYSSPDGKCTECEANYNLNEKNECKKFCSEKNEKIMQMVINKVCVEVDVNCLQWNDDGYCPICIKDFYSDKGKCFKLFE